jgi:hypothetical protein
MKYLRTFESFDQGMVHNNEYPSVEDMKAYVCGCGYDEMEVEEMSYSQVCSTYDICKMETNEAKKNKSTNYKKSGLKNPEKADLNKDKKISGYEKARGKAVQKSMEDQKGGKSGSKQEDDEKSNGKLSSAQKKLPPALQKAIMSKKK